MHRFLILTLVSSFFLLAAKQDKSEYPQNDFRSPIRFPLKLSGTFAELRPNHFHGGLDIKPQKRGRQGDAIVAIADGHISRIRCSAYGYGNALYVTHDNGYTSVYAHLQRFTSDLAKFAKEKQYENQAFELDYTLDSIQFSVKKGEQIGYLGTTGGSLGPHLHFEIRENSSKKTVNPLLFGFNVPDNSAPFMQLLKVYELNHLQETVNSIEYKIKKTSKNSYSIAEKTLQIPSNRVGFGLKTYDLISGTANHNGIYSMAIYANDSLIYGFEMDKFGYDETRFLNAHLDYEHWKETKGYINRGYILKGNELNIYTKKVENGIINLTNTATKIEIIATDIKGNSSKLAFEVIKSDAIPTNNSSTFNYILPYKEASIINRSDLKLHFKEGSFYENIYANIQVVYDGSSDVYSPTFHIHDANIPLHKPYEIKIAPNRFFDKSLTSKLYIGRCEDGKSGYVGGHWEADYLVAKTTTFGDFAILLDTISPLIKPIDFNGKTKKSPRLAFKITDDETGIKTYNVYVDGNWVLMKHDAKREVIFHEFDERTTVGEHQVKVEITDNRDNKAVFEALFLR